MTARRRTPAPTMGAGPALDLDRATALLNSPPPAPIPGQLTVPDGPRIGSLCTGYGGLDMGTEQVLGGSLAWVSDLDPGASRILAHHWPDVPNLGDLTAVDWTTVEPVDVLLGGYPCQPFSLAGHRKGTDDDRHIWPHIARAIRVLRPRLCLFENVSGHVSLGLADVLADLAALRFDAEWVVVRASDTGAPHQRPRVFLAAWPADAYREHAPNQRFVSTAWQGPQLDASATADADDERGHGRAARAGQAGREVTPGRATTDAPRVGLRDTGPASERGFPAAPVASGTAATADSAGAGWSEGGRIPHSVDGEARTRGESEPRRDGAQRILWGPYAAAVAQWEAATGRPAPRPTDDRGRLAPPFVEWMMGLPRGHVTGVPGLSRTAQLRALGNGVVPQQAAYALRVLLDRAGLADRSEVAA